MFVQFTQKIVIPNYPAYQKGDIVNFEDNLAKQFIQRGIAIEIKPEKKKQETDVKKTKKSSEKEDAN